MEIKGRLLEEVNKIADEIKEERKKILILAEKIYSKISEENKGASEDVIVEKTINKLRASLRKIIAKMKSLEEVMGGTETEWKGILLAEGALQDLYANVIKEIDKVIANEGLDVAIAKGMVRMEGDKPYYVDFRQGVGNTKNKYFGWKLDDIPEEDRWRRRFIGVLLGEGGELIPFVWYVRGSKDAKIPLFLPIQFKARSFGQEGELYSLITRKLEFKVLENSQPSNEILASLFRALKPFYCEFGKIRERYEKWRESREAGSRIPAIIASEADVWRIEETANNYRLFLIDGNSDADPIIAFLPKEELNFGEMSRIVFLSSMFEVERDLAGEKIKELMLKISKAVPVVLVLPEAKEIENIPSPPISENKNAQISDVNTTQPQAEMKKVEENKEDKWLG